MIYVLLSTFYIKNSKQRCKFIALGHELTYFIEYGGTQKMMSFEIRRLYKISNKYNTINKHSMLFNNSPGQ
jgi:hypothetical protein